MNIKYFKTKITLSTSGTLSTLGTLSTHKLQKLINKKINNQ